MNKNIHYLSSFYSPSETEKAVLAAVTYLIHCPEIYNQAKDNWGNVSADRVKELYDKKKTKA